MEGVGSRLGRVSSRYVPTATVFNGPVRKWKKKWVNVSSSSNVTYQNSQSQQSNGHNNGSSRLLLCRWTPITPSNCSSAGDGENSSGLLEEEPPRRKFRYTPIVVLDKQIKEVAEKVDDEVKTSENYQSTARPTSKSDDTYGDLNIVDVSMKETQESSRNLSTSQDSKVGHLDLGLCLTGHNDNQKQNKEDQLERVNSGGVWAMD